jgi:ribonuclease Z
MLRFCGIAVFILGLTTSASFTQTPANTPPAKLEVILLGTGGGPPVRLKQFGISTVVKAGDEYFLFDAGRGALQRMVEAGVPLEKVTRLFLTHLHSDHVIEIPDLMLSPWSGPPRRNVPLEVWGPQGTTAMMDHLQKAFAFDIHIRRDVDERFPASGARTVAHEVNKDGVVYAGNGVTVTAFLVDHGPVKPAYGYRLDFGGHSVVLSGDTRPSDNLVKHAAGTDLLIHEIADPDLLRAFAPNMTDAQFKQIISHHTTPEQAGEIFKRVKPRLAVFSHAPNAPVVVKKAGAVYSGRIEAGEDLMRITIGDEVSVERTQRPCSD